MVGAFVFAGVEHVEGVAGLHLALEVDVVGIDPDHVLDDAGRHLVAQRGLVDALVEPDAAAVIIIVVVVVLAVGGLGDGIHALHVDGDIFADVGQRGHGFDGGVVGDDHAVGLQPRRRGRAAGAIRMRSFWPSFRPPSRPRAPSVAAIALASSGVAPWSRRIEVTVSPFLTT